MSAKARVDNSGDRNTAQCTRPALTTVPKIVPILMFVPKFFVSTSIDPGKEGCVMINQRLQ